MAFIATQRTTTSFGKDYPQIHVTDTKIYCIWREYDGTKYQIWTAEMNIDGTGWVATKRTTSAFSKESPQLQVTDTKIYYTWQEYDSNFFYQIWTAEINIDGTGWVATQRTTSAFSKYYLQFQVTGTKIYCIWQEYDSDNWYQIWTAEMNTDGTGWVATQRTTSTFSKNKPQLEVIGTKIYYTWGESDGTAWQIWTAEMNIDSTGWVATKRTTSVSNNYNPQLQVASTKIYYTWNEKKGTSWQVWTAEMNIDGTGWEATQRTTSAYTKNNAQLKLGNTKIYYTWNESDSAFFYQIWTAENEIPIVKIMRCDGFYDPPIPGIKINSCDGVIH